MSGGSPWRLSRLAPGAADVIRRVRAAGSAGLVPGDSDTAVVAALVGRGVLHPLPVRRAGPHDVHVVVPAYRRPDALARCLSGLSGLHVLVVDDASPDGEIIRTVAQTGGAAYLRLATNSGPAAARNAGSAASATELIAFVDSDCVTRPGWLDALVPHFDDERVGVVAPRIAASSTARGVLQRFEAMSSALDMGDAPALVRPGGAMGFVPSAALVVRRAALAEGGFDAALRLGEDVDLIWRLADAGWLVRYEPCVVVSHEVRDLWGEWLTRRFEYGTSAANLELLHPGRLAPVRLAAWNAATIVLLMRARPVAAVAISVVASSLLTRSLRARGGGPLMASGLVARGLLADGVAVGHGLRREYWPLGAAALLATPWSRSARVAAGLMLGPVAWDWIRSTRMLDPARYAAVRLLADAAYGTGVHLSAWRSQTVGPLVPVVRDAKQLDPRRWRRGARGVR